jgi:hypothetical protein
MVLTSLNQVIPQDSLVNSLETSSIDVPFQRLKWFAHYFLIGLSAVFLSLT